MMGFGLSLRELRLIAVDVSDEIIEHLLSHCPLLELTQVHGTRSLASFECCRRAITCIEAFRLGLL